MKREDLSGFGMGGNKVRKFEFFMAEALKEGADCCVAIGALQSNHTRVTAAAALHCGLKAYLLLMGEEPSQLKGNLLCLGEAILELAGSASLELPVLLFLQCGGSHGVLLST